MASTIISAIESANAAKEAKEAHDEAKKEPKSPILPVVLGSMVVKAAYYVLGFFAVALFFATLYSIIATALTQVITSVDITMKNELVFPTTWICIDQTSDTLASIGFFDQGDNGLCKAEGRDPDNGDFQLLATTMTNDFKRKESCVNLEPRTKFTAWLKEKMDKMAPRQDPAGWKCFSFNEDGKLKDVREAPAHFKLAGNIELKPGGESEGFMVVVGFVSPDQIQKANENDNYSDVFHSNLQYQSVDLFNSNTIVQYTLDQLVDLSDEFQFQPKTSIEEGDHVNNIYQAAASSRKLSSLPTTADEFEVEFRTSTFFVREVVMRRKSFQEIWTEIGGAWASAMLLLALFFSTRTVQDGATLKNVHLWQWSTGAQQDTLVHEYERSRGKAGATRQGASDIVVLNTGREDAGEGISGSNNV